MENRCRSETQISNNFSFLFAVLAACLFLRLFTEVHRREGAELLAKPTKLFLLHEKKQFGPFQTSSKAIRSSVDS